MPVLEQLASSLGRRDEEPNLILARTIAQTDDRDAVQELVGELGNQNREIQSDCIKVLYEVGALKPALIADHVETFIRLLDHPYNRLVWGGMTALGAIVALRTEAVAAHLDAIKAATARGSVITQAWGIRVLAAIAASDGSARARVMPFLFDFLRQCPPKDLPRHGESLLIALTPADQPAFLDVLRARRSALQPAQVKRLDHLIKKIGT